MKNMIHYAFILDQSGSMEVLAKEVVSSFNEQVDMIRVIKKKEQEFDLKITLCTFNDKIGFRYVAQSINKLNKLNQIDYQPHSCTALYDAMGSTMMTVSLNEDGLNAMETEICYCLNEMINTKKSQQ